MYKNIRTIYSSINIAINTYQHISTLCQFDGIIYIKRMHYETTMRKWHWMIKMTRDRCWSCQTKKQTPYSIPCSSLSLSLSLSLSASESNGVGPTESFARPALASTRPSALAGSASYPPRGAFDIRRLEGISFHRCSQLMSGFVRVVCLLWHVMTCCDSSFAAVSQKSQKTFRIGTKKPGSPHRDLWDFRNATSYEESCTLLHSTTLPWVYPAPSCNLWQVSGARSLVAVASSLSTSQSQQWHVCTNGCQRLQQKFLDIPRLSLENSTMVTLVKWPRLMVKSC